MFLSMMPCFLIISHLYRATCWVNTFTVNHSFICVKHAHARVQLKVLYHKLHNHEIITSGLLKELRCKEIFGHWDFISGYESYVWKQRIRCTATWLFHPHLWGLTGIVMINVRLMLGLIVFGCLPSYDPLLFTSDWLQIRDLSYKITWPIYLPNNVLTQIGNQRCTAMESQMICLTHAQSLFQP